MAAFFGTNLSVDENNPYFSSFYNHLTINSLQFKHHLQE